VSFLLSSILGKGDRIGDMQKSTFSPKTFYLSLKAFWMISKDFFVNQEVFQVIPKNSFLNQDFRLPNSKILPVSHYASLPGDDWKKEAHELRELTRII
jgi:hypothetical protein